VTTKLCITFNGRHFSYRGYCYDHFTDAVNYARLDRSRAFVDDDAPPAPAEAPLPPTENERVLMSALGVSFVDGMYCWREYRYERLADALACAERALER
jgi:hypothetical protein